MIDLEKLLEAAERTIKNKYYLEMDPHHVKALVLALIEARQALKFYGQEPVNDFRKNEWNDSCREWGMEPTTWEPLVDLGDKARDALKKLDEILGEEK